MLLSTVDILDRFQIVGDRIHSGSRRAAALLVDVFLLDLQIELGHQLLGCVTAKEGGGEQLDQISWYIDLCIDDLPHQVLQIADKAIDVALARCLVDDVLVVVVAQAPAQLLVVHLGLVLADAPATRHLWESRESMD